QRNEAKPGTVCRVCGRATRRVGAFLMMPPDSKRFEAPVNVDAARRDLLLALERVALCTQCRAWRVFVAGTCTTCLHNAHDCAQSNTTARGRCRDCGSLRMRRGVEVSP